MSLVKRCVKAWFPVAACLLLVQCSADERSQAERKLALAPQGSNTTAGTADFVRRQRDLLAALQARHSLEKHAMTGFTVRNHHAGALTDSAVAAQRRQIETLQALNVRPVLDTTVLAEAGDLLTYTRFQTYPLSANQVIVLAHDQRGSTILTSWLRSGAEWRARNMILNPSPVTIAGVRDRSTAERTR